MGICRAGPCLPAAVALPILAEAMPGEQGTTAISVGVYGFRRLRSVDFSVGVPQGFQRV